MKRILKQVVGIDVAQKELVVCLSRLNEDLTSDLYAHQAFANNEKGFKALLLWVGKQTDRQIALRFVMEATGVYHELLAYYLDERGYDLSIVLPNKISNYMRTLDVKTITDKTASEAIARFGLERTLNNWQKPREVYRNLKQLTRERDQLVEERTMIKNQLHAEQAEAFSNKNSIKRIKDRLKILVKQDKEIKAEIEAIIEEDEQVKEQAKLLCTIPGIGLLTAAIVLGETNGFELIRNRRQLASYAGFDIKEKQSGTSVKGKPRISKKGNRHLRKAMYLPALAAIRFDPRAKAIFTRLVSKHGIKMKAAVAVQRKLLEMTYTIFKTKTEYAKDYLVRMGIKSQVTETAIESA